MARIESKIVTAAVVTAAPVAITKPVVTLATLKTDLKLANGVLKDLTKTAKTATSVAAKQAAVVTKLQAKIDKLTPPKAVTTGTGVGIAATAATAKAA